MFWVDVIFLKECLYDIGWEDLVVKLIVFEIKWDLFIFFNFYVKRRNGLYFVY